MTAVRLPFPLSPPRRWWPAPSAAVVTALSESSAARTVRWAGTLFVLLILIQRFSVPGMPVPMLLPVVMLWLYLAIRARVVEIDPLRFMFWVVAVAVTGLAMLIQTIVHPIPIVSVNSWALLNVVWFPAVARFADRRLSTYRALLQVVVRVCLVLAVACIVMMAVQLAGVPYVDLLRQAIPATFLEQGFTIASPVEFGSKIYRANAWIGLEPSTTSYQIGIGLLAAILIRSKLWIIGIMIVGMFATVAGSGFLLVLLGVAAMLAFPARRNLVRFLVPAVVLGGILLSTPFGQTMLSRTDEASSSESSASLRAVQPYSELWPTWTTEPATALIGGGAGASQRVVDISVLRGLVPLPAKVFYDYGLIFGVVLAAFLIFCYLDGLSATFAFTFSINLWTIQPGSNIPVFVIPVLLLVTLWAPRSGPRIEDT